MHYLKNVLRLKEGSQFKAFDDTGVEYLLEVRKTSPLIEARILETIRVFSEEPSINIEFCPSICRMKVFESTIEKAAELGVTRIIPVITSRSHNIPQERLLSKIKRWYRIAAEGSKISGRIKIPEVHTPERLNKIMAEPGINIFFWEQSEENLKQLIPLIRQQISNKKTLRVFIGPEGGFTEEEAELARRNNSLVAGLGKRILKVETAAIAAISILLYEFTST